jgi:hypothetical protein
MSRRRRKAELRASLLPLLAPLLAVAVAASCGDDDTTGPAPTPERTWEDCQAGDEAFVRRVIPALTARRPASSSEVRVLVEVMEGVRAQGGSEEAARAEIVRILATEAAFSVRWGEFFKDALQIVRSPFVRTAAYDLVQTQTCYVRPEQYVTSALAEYVRDNAPSASTPPIRDFTMGQLVESAIALDDLSPVYRAHLFHMLTTPLAGANVAPMELERARRNDFGTIFEDAYLNRDPNCLPCHNSQFSVTFSDDPELNRAWPVPGRFEELVFGAASGPPDPIVSRSVFRHVGVADAEGMAPWGWGAQVCGVTQAPRSPDPLGIDASFAGIRSTPSAPQAGYFASVWAVEHSLRLGFEALVTRQSFDDLTDGNEAFAYLVAQTIVDKVWGEVMGSRLTIATRFPRTEAQRDVLADLTAKFIQSRYSLRRLLSDIVVHPAFNLSAPEAGCGAPYEVPRIYDPWTNGESVAEAERLNSPADGVFAIGARPLRRMIHEALEWPAPEEFPRDEEQEATHIGLGMFVRPSEPGSRGFDLHGSLLLEETYGTCEARAPQDYVTKLIRRGSSSGAPLEEVVITLKDRLIGEPWVDDVERGAVESLLGEALTAPVTASSEAGLRRVCGAYLLSPQFLLAGLSAPPADVEPLLTAPEHSRPVICADVATRHATTDSAYVLECGDRVSVALR